MKKRFTLEVMYGDADGYETFSYITENEDEIKFLTYFLEGYDDDLFLLYVRPDLVKYYRKIDLNKLAETINQMVKLSAPICEENEFDVMKSYKKVKKDYDKTVDGLYDVFCNIMTFVSEMFDWSLYHSGMDYHGSPNGYNIEDITGCVEITRKDAIQLIKEKLGIDVVFID